MTINARIILIIFLVDHLLSINVPGLIIGGVSMSYYGGKKLYCRFRECCTEMWIPHDIKDLLNDLERNVFGQPHIGDLGKLIIGHSMSKHSNKPLVISIHGPTGTGKNFVAGIVADRLFKTGRNSKFIKTIIGSHGFSDSSKIHEIRDDLLESISDTVSSCSLRSLIIIDEVDKFPTGLLDNLRPLMHARDDVDGIDFRKTIFILISNSGQEEIGKLAYDFASRGKDRSGIKYLETEKMLRSYLFNSNRKDNSGFYGSLVVGTSDIDHYFAFFPLDKNHVKQCIRSHAQQSNVSEIEDCVSQIIQRIEFIPDDYRYFSATGCKKVNIFVDAFC